MAIKIIDENLQFKNNYTVRNGAPKGIVHHHSGMEGEASLKAIHEYHINVNGWAGFGYHFYVAKDGTIYRGRPENWIGAHTVGFNDRIGICAEGNFETEKTAECPSPI